MNFIYETDNKILMSIIFACVQCQTAPHSDIIVAEIMKVTVVVLAAMCCTVQGQFGFFKQNPISSGLGTVQDTVNSLNILDEQFSGFESKFQKTYSAAEAPIRKANFKENFETINKLNEGVTKGLSSVLEEINEFGDMIWDEFSKLFNGFRLSRVGPSKAEPFVPPATETLPESVDWRKEGAVSAVKHQQQCAGCWAFSAAGALEGQIQRKTGKLSEVSIQSLLDCAKGDRYGNDGCGGGLVETGFDYISDNNGIDGDSSYPYEAKDGSCRYKKENVVGECKGYVRVPDGDEKSLQKAVATVGPIAAAIHAVPRFQFYKDGVIDYPDCGNQPDNLNHAILIVGYGKEADGKEYWLVKNSYGPGWGIDGYFKVARNAGNKCGIATYARYPKV